MTAKEKSFKILFNEARIAGLEAVSKFTPRPMVVTGMGKSYYVPSGVCGFASVIITPGNSPAANYARKNLRTYKHYYGGLEIPVSEFGQSMEMKQVYARAFAGVLSAAGVSARSDSRMD